MNISTSIVFITGTFLGNNCWDEWLSFFESRGYKCIAPSWPYKEASPETLRNRHPDAAIASNSLATLTDHYTGIINALPEKPILIGHALGGLMVQLLLQRGLATAAVAVHSFPPQSVNRFKFSFLSVIWEAMGFFTDVNRSYLISFKKWKRAITNGMTCEQQKESYYKYAIPESKMISREVFTGKTKINFSNPHPPLLFTSGGRDKLIPASVNYGNFKKYKQDYSITAYKEFKEHNHLVFGELAWAEEADFILYWLQGINQ